MKHLLKCIFVSFVALTVTATACWASQDALAQEKALEAESHLKTTVKEVLAIVQDEQLAATPKAHEQALYDKAFEIFDFTTFSMLALGPKFRSFTDPQKEDFIYYFSKMISQTYFPKLAEQDVKNVEIVYLKNTPLDPRRGVYRTDILTELVQKDLRIPVEYRMILRENQDWRVYDIKIEGVSMVANYREQYSSQTNATPEQIINQLKEKVTE